MSDISVRFNPRNDGAYNEGDAKKARPTDVPNATRSFKNVLDKDNKPKGNEKVAKKPLSTSDEEEDTALSLVEDEENEGKKEAGFSLFAQRKTKIKLSNEPPPSNEDFIADADAEIKTKKKDAPHFEAEAPPDEALEESPVFAQAPAVPKEKVKVPVNPDTIAKEIPKGLDKEATEVAASAQQPVAPVPQKKELTNLYGPSRSNRSATKEKADVDSPAALFAKQSKQTIHSDDEGTTSHLEDANLVAENTGKKKENLVSPFSQEKSDISTINPQGIVQPAGAAEVVGPVSEGPKFIAPSATLQALIEHLAKEINVMTKGDKTETTVTLNHPPLFAGAQIVVTGYDSARKEMNITFANLTQNAQALIQEQQRTLLDGLEAKGYFVHIFVATTTPHEPIVVRAETQQPNKERQSREEGGEGREQQRRYPQG